MVIKIYKSASDGMLGKQEFLKELRTRLIRGKLKIEEVEKITAEYYKWHPKEQSTKQGNNRLWVIESQEKKGSIEDLQK